MWWFGRIPLLIVKVEIVVELVDIVDEGVEDDGVMVVVVHQVSHKHPDAGVDVDQQDQLDQPRSAYLLNAVVTFLPDQEGELPLPG